MTTLAGKLSGQAKALSAAVAIILIQVRMIVTARGYADLTEINLSEWLDVTINTLVAYAGVYMIPNAAKTIVGGRSVDGPPIGFAPR